MKPLGIICGSGEYPFLVAQRCARNNLDFCLILLDGFYGDFDWPSAPKLIIGLGEIGKALDFLRANDVKAVTFAGHVKRPKLSQLSLDKTGIRWASKLGRAIFSGDDVLLRTISALLEEEGMEIIAGTDLLEDVFLSEGVLSRKKPSEDDLLDIKIGLSEAKNLGLADRGQAVIVHRGEVLGLEDADGTERLIYSAAMRRKEKNGGVLVKVSKPQQDNRLDLPAIGVDTILQLHKNGFSGVAVESGKCIILNKKLVIEKANRLGLFVMGCAF